jgi:hypothetical protein
VAGAEAEAARRMSSQRIRSGFGRRHVNRVATVTDEDTQRRVSDWLIVSHFRIL